MKYRSQISALLAVSVVATALALPAVSQAEYYVPPANSAANQYTESFPGAGGESGGKRKDATPGATLGAGNAKRLESKGPAGEAAAEVAAETAPPQLSASTGNGDGGEGQTGSKEQAGGSGGGNPGNGGGSGSSGTGGSKGGSTGSDGGSGAGKVQQPQGASGFGQVLGQATGAGDGASRASGCRWRSC